MARFQVSRVVSQIVRLAAKFGGIQRRRQGIDGRQCLAGADIIIHVIPIRRREPRNQPDDDQAANEQSKGDCNRLVARAGSKRGFLGAMCRPKREASKSLSARAGRGLSKARFNRVDGTVYQKFPRLSRARKPRSWSDRQSGLPPSAIMKKSGTSTIRFMNTLRVGIIGFGRIGAEHAGWLGRHPTPAPSRSLMPRPPGRTWPASAD